MIKEKAPSGQREAKSALANETKPLTLVQLWNYYQERLEPHRRSTIVYGHDSKRGLMIKEYSKGLDTGCLKGGQLTALVIDVSHSGVKQNIVQIECTAYMQLLDD